MLVAAGQSFAPPTVPIKSIRGRSLCEIEQKVIIL